MLERDYKELVVELVNRENRLKKTMLRGLRARNRLAVKLDRVLQLGFITPDKYGAAYHYMLERLEKESQQDWADLDYIDDNDLLRHEEEIERMLDEAKEQLLGVFTGIRNYIDKKEEWRKYGQE